MKRSTVIVSMLMVTCLSACGGLGSRTGITASMSTTVASTAAPTTTVAPASTDTVAAVPGSFAALQAACAPGVDASTFGEIVGALKPAPAADASFTTLDYINQLTELVPSNPYWVLGIADGINRGDSCLVAFQLYMPKAPPQGGGGHGNTNTHGSGSGTGTGTPAPLPTTPSTPASSTPLPVIPPASVDAPVYTVPPTPSTPPTAAPVTTVVAPAPPVVTDPPTTTPYTGVVTCDTSGCHY